MPPIDPPESPRYALEGRVVTMNGAFEVHDKARVYVDRGGIQAVVADGADVPPELADARVVRTRGTIYPGLIELHNHLSFNALPPWVLPKQFEHRGQWPRHPDYRRLINGPASVLGSTAGYVEAVVRYVEAKCLVAGVTTSQGVTLKANSGIKRYYRGLVRNVEQTGDTTLPNAATRIEDVEASEVDRFLERLRKSTSLLLHLSEGFGTIASRHFQALHVADDTWAISPALAGIHCTGLRGGDFDTLRDGGGSMIWSPLSNVLLYGDTADIVRARDAGVLMALGSDWSPSGSKNLLGELKMARVWSDRRGGVFSSRDLAAMVTTNPARILKWHERLGSIRAGFLADLMVLEGVSGDVYDKLVRAREDDVSLVIINGIPRCGRPALMTRLGAAGTESITVGGEARRLSLAQATADPLVGTLTLAEARDRLADGLRRLPELALQLEDPRRALAMLGSRESMPAGDARRRGDAEARWVLDFDHEPADGLTSRPQLPLRPGGEVTGVFARGSAAEPLSSILEPLELDALAVVDDERLGASLAAQPNVDPDVRRTLARLLGVTLTAPVRRAGPQRRLGRSARPAPFQTLRDLLEAARSLPPRQRKALLARFTAYVPFRVVRRRSGAEVRWYVASLAAGPAHPSFAPGAELRYWNGTPVGTVADRFSNLRALTERPLRRYPAPQEEWVTVTYQGTDGARRELRRRWLVR